MLSDLQRHQGETAEALTLARKARTVFERLIADHPDHTSFPLDLAKSHNTIGRLLKRTGDSAEALRSFQRPSICWRANRISTPQSRYNLACNAALCVSLIGSNDQSKGNGSPANELSKGDQLRQRIYGDRAISSLRRAIAGGFLDADLLQSNADFDSIRHRSDFQALVKEVEDKPATAGK